MSGAASVLLFPFCFRLWTHIVRLRPLGFQESVATVALERIWHGAHLAQESQSVDAAAQEDGQPKRCLSV